MVCKVNDKERKLQTLRQRIHQSKREVSGRRQTHAARLKITENFVSEPE